MPLQAVGEHYFAADFAGAHVDGFADAACSDLRCLYYYLSRQFAEQESAAAVQQKSEIDHLAAAVV